MFPTLRRVAAHPSRQKALISARGVALTLWLVLTLLGAMLLPADALAADPSPVLIDPLDPRAEGEGPGLVGDPLLAALIVLGLGVLAAALAAAYVRLVRPR